MAKASAWEAHLFLDGFQDTSMREYLSKSCRLSHPGRHGRSRFRRDLNCYRRKRHTTSSPFSRGRRFYTSSWLSWTNQPLPPLLRVHFAAFGPDAVMYPVRLGWTCCFAQSLHGVGVTVVEEATGFGIQRPD